MPVHVAEQKMEPSSFGGGLVLEDFGQKIDLTKRIREILVNYPEGTTVLKELIQNADDAGATNVRFCLDRRIHGVRSLLSDKLAEWQGPALLSYNNAEFSEADFVSISRIGDSTKQGQPWKTGRFGVGFNSVYHLTDLPSFLSGKYVVLFDPQNVYLPNVMASNPGKRLDFVNSSAISIYKDQFAPYCAFGCDMKTPFPGTIFRFPLRNTSQASTSKLSRQVYSEDDICSMFDQLYKEIVFTMLFLKNILSVEMYIWDHGESEPYKRFSCVVNSTNDSTIFHRQALLRLPRSNESTDGMTGSFSIEFLCEAIAENYMERRLDNFFIVYTLAPSSSKAGSFAISAAKEYDVHLIPWGSVAACLSQDLDEADIMKQGHAFCFLPLPVKTGLSVQVNGYFEVSSNRRGIWYGADMDRGGKLRSDWNRLLLEDVLAPTFVRLLLEIRPLLGPCKSYYSLWPNSSFEEPWNFLIEQIYINIVRYPVLYSDCEGGQWVLPFDAFLQDNMFLSSKELNRALIQLGMPIVHLAHPIVVTLHKYCANLKDRAVTPITVLHFLNKCKPLINFDRCTSLLLLEYCLRLDDSDIIKHASGLPLLPLGNGNFGQLSKVSNGKIYFICNDLEYRLLSSVSSHQLIDRNIPNHIFSRLSAIAESSKVNIVLFQVDYFVQLLPRFFPVEWRYKDRVFWDHSIESNPTASWFMLFWQYLQNHCPNLSVFGDWPILPSTNGHLYKPSKLSKLINAEQLSDKMKAVLSRMGCKILNPDYSLEHPHLSQFVYNTDALDVLSAIFDVISSDNALERIFNDFCADEKKEIRSFLLNPKWYVSPQLTETYLQNCKKLPIYEVFGDGSSCTLYFSDLKRHQKYLPPQDVPLHLLGDDFINCTSDTEEEILSRYYGVHRMGKTVFYKQHVFNRIRELPSELRDETMFSVLQNLPQLCMEDASLREELRKLDFVPTIGGLLKKPQSLYDPRNEELYALLEDSDCFPCGIFEESSVLDMLLGLGLRNSVSPETIILVAHKIESMVYTDQTKAYQRGKDLLWYLEVNASKWSINSMKDGKKQMNKMLSKDASTFKSYNIHSEDYIDKFWNELKVICWCPVLVDPPYPSLPWPLVSSLVAPPKLVRLPADLWLVSASMRILDGECSSSALSLNLGWSFPPTGSIIAAQLLELGKNNEVVTDKVLRKELTLAMPRIYSILISMIGSDEIDIVKAILESSRWIWVGDGFAIVDEVVLSGPLHLAPYIRVIPTDLAVFKDLFLELGLREYLKPVDYINILNRMYRVKSSNPLNAHELRAAVLVAQHLSEVNSDDLQVDIHLPDVSARLLPSSELVYNDAPWLVKIGESSTFEDIKTRAKIFIHGNISNDVAEKLGVCSLRRVLLSESADSMNLSLSSVEAFGQHEALTTRLKHIVEMYSDGPGILFELVQNAEDAGASEVVFLLDKTQYGTSSLLSPQMADWQGPSLYCFNDSVFTPHDLHAISRIGQDSKLEKPFAIGRFGLGFNCVYHFTDVPGFVSGENLVIFDPHACNLPGISPSQPGLRIKFVANRILEQFPDQFSPFLLFGCNLEQPFPGTLFRFPLRCETSASRSEIKKEKYKPEDVLSLFSSFSKLVSETLPFLRKVRTVSIFVKDGAAQEMHLLHRVHRIHVGTLNDTPHPLQPLLYFTHGDEKSEMNEVQFYNKLSKTEDNDLPFSCQMVMVKEENSIGTQQHLWMTSECIGGGRAKKRCLSMHKRSHNFIPWACVSSYLLSVDMEEVGGDSVTKEAFSINDISCMTSNFMKGGKMLEGRAFCFLPLPICTGLPVHMNAYFELASNRRDLWFGNDMTGGGKMKSDWNLFLLEDVIAPAYAHLLEKIATVIGPCDSYLSLWPTKVDSGPWTLMIQRLYKCIIDLRLHVLYTKARGGQWISTKQAIFPDFTFLEASELEEALSEAGLPLVVISKSIVERFNAVCPSLHFLRPQMLRTLLSRRKRLFKNKDSMVLTLKYCLSDLKEPAQYDTLYGLQLVPLANGQLTAFNRLGEGERIFITNQIEYDLLKDFIPHLLVDRTISGEVFDSLCNISQSGDLNVSLLSCQSLASLLPIILPNKWKDAKQIFWTPGQHDQPGIEWMEKFWNYLKLSCIDLSEFSNWPLLPLEDGHLVQITVNSSVIKNDGWSENMASLLQKIGCSFLRSDLSIDHPQLKKFVQDTTADGILNVLLVVSRMTDIKTLFNNASEGEIHEFRTFILQSKWFHGDKMNSNHINLIKSLPIFETYRNGHITSLEANNKCVKPDGVHKSLLDENFVRTGSERETVILIDYLGIKKPTKVEFYHHYVLNRMSEFLSQPAVISLILFDVKHLIQEDNCVQNLLLQTPFILGANGSWQHPSRLYDPRVPGLRKILHKEAFFPSEKFFSSENMEILVSLGIKTTLGLTGLLDSARSISMLHDSKDPETLNYGKQLLTCLNVLGYNLCCKKREENGIEIDSTFTAVQKETDSCCEEQLLLESCDESCSKLDPDIQSCLGDVVDENFEEQFWSEMKTIPWCPVYVQPLLKGFPWTDSNHEIAPPSTVRPKSYMWMVSSKMQILDGDCCSHYTQHKLGWLDLPSAYILSNQLIELSRCYSQHKVHNEEALLIATLQQEIPKLYSKLQDYVCTSDFKFIKSALNGVSWVWIGDDFVPTKSLAFDSPVKFQPYLYVVPSELSEFKLLLSEVGVRLTFDIVDYVDVLQCLYHDCKGLPLSSDQLSCVCCILETISDLLVDKPLDDKTLDLLLVPDSSGILMHPMDVMYDDAPWMEKNGSLGKHFLHPTLGNVLAKRLGIQSFSFMSLADEQITTELPCLDHERIQNLLDLYGGYHFLLFDLLELADCSEAKKLHLIFDERDHPKRSLLQPNLGEFQGSALVAIIDGANWSREEACSLQLLPPWRLHGNSLSYGLGLISCYFICDVIEVLSGDHFYLFDPHGIVLATSSNCGPCAKMYSLSGTNLIERFHDQFEPMLIGHNHSWSSTHSVVIRMPLSSKFMKENDSSLNMGTIFDTFTKNASRSLLFLKSILQVSLSTWEAGNSQPRQDYCVSIEPSSSIMRNPFSEKKWKKFQLSRLFGSLRSSTKFHIIDIHVSQAETEVIDKWLVALSLGSGRTRNMALDRSYIAYNLTPVAGVGVHISQNGNPSPAYSSGCILSPLPLSGDLNIPVTALGYFLVCHSGGRYLFHNSIPSEEPHGDANNQLMKAWNKELMSCVRDSYIELVLEFQKLRRDPFSSNIDSNSAGAISTILSAYGDQLYQFWPRSKQHSSFSNQPEVINTEWKCIIDEVIRPFYAQLVDLPVWKLYGGNLVKAADGMFLSQPRNETSDTLPNNTVCSFIKEHYPVFSVPWELVNEIQAVGITVKEIKPKMVRDLLKSPPMSISLQSVETYLDVLDYCFSDIQVQMKLRGNETQNIENEMEVPAGSHSITNRPSIRESFLMHTQNTVNSDAIEMMTNIGKVLFDFGRGVVEDISKAGDTFANSDVNPSRLSLIGELKGLPCPTATKRFARLGVSELWVGTKDQQLLMLPLSSKFIHSSCLDRPILAEIFSNLTVQRHLKLKVFSHSLLSSHMKVIFSDLWVSHVIDLNKAAWVNWEKRTDSGSPSPEWIQLFWRSFNGSWDDLPLFLDWPLVPAFLGRSILCRVKDHHLVFIPPFLEPCHGDESLIKIDDRNQISTISRSESDQCEPNKSYFEGYGIIKARYPWLLGLLTKCNIPIYDVSFSESNVPYNHFPTPGQSLGHVLISKMIASKYAGYFSEPNELSDDECDELFRLFAASSISTYKSEEIEMLRSLPIYKTLMGNYTRLHVQDHCIISSNAFFQPRDKCCICDSLDINGHEFIRALGVPQLNDREILVRFALPQFEENTLQEQENILIYLYANWQYLQHDSTILGALSDAKFVRNSDELNFSFFRPRDLLDPCDSLLVAVFSGERDKFPGERFSRDGWLHILRKTGLRNSLEADMILECARKVELLGIESIKCIEDQEGIVVDLYSSHDEISFDLCCLASSIVDAIFANFAVLYGNNFCDALSKIRFIPSERGFPTIGGKKGGKRVLTSYSEAIFLKDWYLAWSSAPILVSQNVVPPEYSWGALHLRSPPPFSLVLKHLQVIGRNYGEDALAHWPMSLGTATIEEASCEVLKYLDKVWGSLSSSDIMDLQKVSFIPVANGTRLLPANSLFIRLALNLAPFTFELPALYLPYVRILKEIGLQDTFSIHYAKEVLINIQKSCGYQRLNPNELRAIMEILHFICDSIKESPEETNWTSDIIIPDDGCRLVAARFCVYIDAYGSKFIQDIDTSRLRFVHSDVPVNICTVLGVRKLSDVVVEELDHGQKLQTLDQIGSVSLEMVKKKLSSKALQDAVWVVLNSTIGGFTQQQVQSSLISMAEKLQFVQYICTRFFLLSKNMDITRTKHDLYLPEWESRPGHHSLYFCDQSMAHVLIAEPPSYVSLFDVISLAVSRVLGSPSALHLAPLFSSPEDSEALILNTLKIGSSRIQTGAANWIDTLIGKELLLQDALQVQFCPLRPFYSGEMIAWRLSQDGEKLKYGRVPEDVRPFSGQALYRLLVETAPRERQILLSSQVLSFKSASSTRMNSSVISPDNNLIDIENEDEQISEGKASKRAGFERAKELQRGHVSSFELVQAVHDLLSAAGVSMDAESQTQLQTILSLQEQLKESQTALLLEQEKAETAVRESEAAKTAWSCRICLTSEVDIAIVPCGHILCRRCASAVSRCPFCRHQVSGKQKLFRP